jgi:hypothetical protein
MYSDGYAMESLLKGFGGKDHFGEDSEMIRRPIDRASGRRRAKTIECGGHIINGWIQWMQRGTQADDCLFLSAALSFLVGLMHLTKQGTVPSTREKKRREQH